jgi:ABC-2 type transport system permease protein
MTSVTAELLVVRKRSSTWILLGIWSALAVLFAYVIPYVEYLNGSGPGPRSLGQLLPAQLAGNLVEGFPFFGGVIALMLGVLGLGSEYGWGTLKTLFIQREGRLRVFGAKLLALGAVLVPFALSVFALGAAASYVIALREGSAVDWPSAWLVVRAMGAGWLILAVWASFGLLLAAVSRGTSLAIGVGILYALPAGKRVFARQRTRSLRHRGRGQRPRRFQRAVRLYGPGPARPRRVHGGLPHALGTPPPPARRDLGGQRRG